MKRKIWIACLLLLLLLTLPLLVACGGDSDYDDDEYSGIEITYYITEDGEPHTLYVYEGDNYLASLPKRDGYTFLGLYDSPTGGTMLVDEKGEFIISVTGPLTMYARWEAKSYKLVLTAEDGITIPEGEEERTLVYDSAITTLPVLEKEGHDFLGWENANGDRISDGGAVLEKCTAFNLENYCMNKEGVATLTAVFAIKQMTVTFDFNNNGDVRTVTIPWGTELTADSFPDGDDGERRIYAWMNGTDKAEPGMVIKENITLYAVWKHYHTATLYDQNDKKHIVYVYEGEVFDLLNYDGIVYPGHEAEGWYTNKQFTGNPVDTLTYGNVGGPYYANWVVATYTLIFDAVSAGDSYDPIVYQMGETHNLPILTRYGYTFDGWCLKQDCSDEPITSISKIFWGSYTLYAKFTPDKVTVSLNPNKGKVSATAVNVYYQQSYELPVPKREGGTFLGWFDGKDANATRYTDDQGKSVRNYDSLEGITLYAKWSVNSYTVTFNTVEGSYVAPLTIEHGDTLVFPKAPTKAGHYFKGWFNQSGTVCYDTNYVVTGALTLYARWTANKPDATAKDVGTISLKGNSGSFNGNYYCLIPGNYDWEEAMKLCQEMGGHLATVTSKEEDAFLYRLWKKSGVTNPCWLGATDKDEKGVWKWVTGEAFTYKGWSSGQPVSTKNHNYLEYYKDGWYNDDNDSYKDSFICEWERGTSIPVETGASFGSSTYRVFAGKYDWVTAKALCEALGGHLATITSAEEDAFVYNLCVMTGQKTCLLGATDAGVEGVWKWVTGEPFDYSNWHAKEPNSGTAENYLSYYSSYTDGKWCDIQSQNSFVCEWDNIEEMVDKDAPQLIYSSTETFDDAFYFGGHLYKIYTHNYTYSQAKAYCENIGGHLVTIDNASENMGLFFYTLYAGQPGARFGMTDENREGTWVTVDGNEMPYTHWYPGEPNDSNGEDYCNFSDGTGGYWNDIDWSSVFICEWDYWEMPN